MVTRNRRKVETSRLRGLLLPFFLVLSIIVAAGTFKVGTACKNGEEGCHVVVELVGECHNEVIIVDMEGEQILRISVVPAN